MKGLTRIFVALVVAAAASANLVDGSQFEYQPKSFTWKTIMEDFVGDTWAKKMEENFPFLKDNKTNEIVSPFDYLNFLEAVKPNTSYLSEANAESHLYVMEREADFENRHKRDFSYSSANDKLISGGPVVDRVKCRQQLRWLNERVAREPENLFRNGFRDLMLWLDSWGRPEADTYRGNAYWYGSYDECIKSHLETDHFERLLKKTSGSKKAGSANSGGVGLIKMRYCLGKLTANSWPTNDTIIPRTTIKVGFCLPETCDSSSLSHDGQEAQLIESLMLMNFAPIYSKRYQLVDLYCLPDERSPLRSLNTSGRLFVAFWLVWLSGIAWATYRYATKASKEQKHPSSSSLVESVVESLSLTKNIETLMAWPRPSNINLNGISFIKVISTASIILGHSFYYNVIVFKTTQVVSDFSGTWWSNIFNSITLTNDIFYGIGAMLWAYAAMKELHYKKQDPIEILKPMNYLRANLDKILRLSPVFIMNFWFVSSINTHLGSGPSWDYGTDHDSITGSCMRSEWYKAIIYFGSENWHPAPRCCDPAWYLVTFVRIMLIMPFILYLLIKFRKWRVHITIIIVTITSLRAAMIHSQYARFDALSFLLYRVKALEIGFKYSQPVYVTFIYRVSSMVIGALGGLFLFDYDVGNIKQWPNFIKGKWFALAMWSNLVVFLMPVITNLFSEWLKGASDSMNLILLFAVQILFNINNLILYLRISTDLANANWFMRFMSNPVWALISRITYCIYSFHSEIFWFFIKGEPKGTISWRKLIKETSTVLVLSTIISTILYVLFESPVDRLIRAIFRSRAPPPKQQVAPGSQAKHLKSS